MPPSKSSPFLKPLREFAAAVTRKTAQFVSGEPEEQLRAPFEALIAECGALTGKSVVCTGEVALPDSLGSPDYAIHVDGLLAGYVELKAPGKGANGSAFRGHDLQQFKRFAAVPNILYTDGNEWALYRGGIHEGALVRTSRNVAADGGRAVSSQDARAIEGLLRDFLGWQPMLPTGTGGGLDLKSFAEQLAPLCRMLREDVERSLKDKQSPLVKLKLDWRQLLFPDASDSEFADAYAQTVAFALLLGRSEGANPLTLQTAQTSLAARNNLLSRALQVLTDVLAYPEARGSLTASLNLLLRVLGVVPTGALSIEGDPWLYFYEDFLAAYDPKLRKDAGVYYTPVEVVRAQVRLIEEVLVRKLGKHMGFAAKDVVTLDPAVGTGTYLLGVISRTLARVRERQGPGAVPGVASDLAEQLSGFELMAGPYAVAELRVSRALRDAGATLSADSGPHIYLSDTLESPHAKPLQLPLFLRPISEQRSKALEVKSQTPVLVCLGNPPYDRHEAAKATNRARTGGWVRWGDSPEDRPVLEAFLAPARASGHGIHIKNLYNLYIYFWRWALWKVFEHESATGPGVVSFISASSYLAGPAFGGMREHLRRLCDEVWILDLGGEGHAEPRDENVFAIRTPVAIAVAVSKGPANPQRPAPVRYARIHGSREAKLAALDGVEGFDSVTWQRCPDSWQAPFRPAAAGGERAPQAVSRNAVSGGFHDWPLLTDLMPWQHSGTQLKRTWPIAPDEDTLRRRWRGLLTAHDRAVAFRETGDRKIDGTYNTAIGLGSDPTPVARLSDDAPVPSLQRYAYRSFDRQYIIADGRLMSRPRPSLWRTFGAHQVYLSSLLTKQLARGPALTVSARIPDLDHFSGRGAKDTIPLYRTADTSDPNLLPGLLDSLSQTLTTSVKPEDLVAYVYGVLAQPAFCERFSEHLVARELRVPITKDPALFNKARRVGARLLWLHSYGERFVPTGKLAGQVHPGSSRCVAAVPTGAESYPESFRYDAGSQTLQVGAGQFAPVHPEVFEFEVSGLRVVKSWLNYRMKRGGGRKSSPLNDIRPSNWTAAFTAELLELLWVLEATVETYPEQAKLLKAIVEGDCLSLNDLPSVPPEARTSPRHVRTTIDHLALGL